MPLSLVNDICDKAFLGVFEETDVWLAEAKNKHEIKEGLLPWAAFYSRIEERDTGVKVQSKSILLPLLKENFNSPAMVRYAIDIVVKIVKNINPAQTPTITIDQPL